MTMRRAALCLVVAGSLLAGCGSRGPGPLEGTWEMSGPVRMTVVFRDGETEALGIIEKVAYEVKGRDVIVTYKSGPAEGMAVRYTIVGPDLVHTELGTLRRVK